MALPKIYNYLEHQWHNNTTPSINEDELNAISYGLSKIDDRVIDITGTLMEDVPRIIEDMEILEPAIENIDANVTRAETAADNAETEALKSEGYAVGTQDGVEVTSGEYYQNNAKYYAEIANPPIENTVDFTDVIATSDAINKAAKDVRLKVEAVQDLHGYDKPWVGGAGKNLCPTFPASGSAAGVTYTTASNGIVKAVGTSTGQTAFYSVNQVANVLLAGNYIASAGSNASGDLRLVVLIKRANNSSVYIECTSAQEKPFTVYADDQFMSIYIRTDGGNTAINGIIAPMIRLATVSDPTYEPYENICPITGHDEVNVIRVAKNRLNPLSIVQGNPSNPSAPNRCSTMGDKSIPVNVGDKITISRQSTAIRYALGIVNDNGDTLYDSGWQTNDSFSITASRKGYLIFGGFSYLDNANISPTDVRLADFQIEFSEVATEYEPYQGHIYTIDLDGTRYGGTLDVTSGVLTLLGQIYDLGDYDYYHNAGDNRNYFYTTAPISAIKGFANNTANDGISNKYVADSWNNIMTANPTANGKFAISSDKYFGIRDDNANSMSTSDFKTYVTGTKILATLATPQTIQLTPTQVYLLYGYNTLFGDCGDISLTYDASGIIHIEEAKLDTETLKTIAAASNDFADFKARIAAL